jgi:tetrapyrrole methylase family protein/MazG family protein
MESKSGIEGFIDIIAALRHPETGCPWDLKQTQQSLTQHILEEAYEAVEAIEIKSPKDIKEELGDLLLQIVLQAQIASEKNEFTFFDIVESISSKIIRRHPHVFSDTQLKTIDEVADNWQKIKQEEKGHVPSKGILDDISTHQPATQEILKIQKKLSHLGFDFENIDQMIGKVREEFDELLSEIKNNQSEKILDELGDCFAAFINIARFYKLDPDLAMRKVSRKYRRRFEEAYQKATINGADFKSIPLAQKEEYWREAKQKLG